MVIDENLHLRSMRHEYYQMARDCEWDQWRARGGPSEAEGQ